MGQYKVTTWFIAYVEVFWILLMQFWLIPDALQWIILTVPWLGTALAIEIHVRSSETRR